MHPVALCPRSTASTSSAAVRPAAAAAHTRSPPARQQLRVPRRPPMAASQDAAGLAFAAAGASDSAAAIAPPTTLLAGLTGSIGMGKSTVSAMLASHGVPVLSADEVVHQLYSAGGAAVQPVGAAFPSAVVDGAVDRAALSKCVVGNEAAMQQLEALVHPLVEAERLKFVQQHVAAGSPLVVFDIPLLFETRAQDGLDAVLVVSAPAEAQAARVMARPGMTREKLDAILARQVPDAEKRARADFVIDTGCSKEDTERRVVEVIQQLAARRGTAAARLLAGGGDGGGTAPTT